jgi:glycosyltransferase involved in cell wall biosynthesis
MGSDFFQRFLFFRKAIVYHFLYKHVFTNSNLMVEEITRNYKLKESKVSVLHLRVSVMNRIIDDKYDTFRLIIVARVHPSKGFDLLFQAFAVLLNFNKKFKLIIIGDDRDGLIYRWIEEFGLNDNVSFLGLLPTQEVEAEIAKSLLLISASQSEAFGLTMVEAIALGTPVLATRTEGSTEIITEFVDGLFFSNAEEFVDGVLKIQKSRNYYSFNGREKFKRSFSTENILNSVSIIKSKVDF